MPMNLYRRHRPDCEGGHPFDSRSGEFEERKKSWRRCTCYIFASGTLEGQYKRKYTGTSDWTQAKVVADKWAESGSWSGEAPPKPAVVPEPEPAAMPRITIADAVKVFLTHREGAKIAGATLRKYRTFTNQLTAYSEG